MAKQEGMMKITGKMEVWSFMSRMVNFSLKTPGGASKKKILSNPNFARTRENMQEFGASAALAKSFRNGFAGVSDLFRTSTLSGKVTGIMKNINRAGEGLRGARRF